MYVYIYIGVGVCICCGYVCVCAWMCVRIRASVVMCIVVHGCARVNNCALETGVLYGHMTTCSLSPLCAVSCHKNSHLLAHSRTTRTHARTHALTHSRTHTCTHSLTHSIVRADAAQRTSSVQGHVGTAARLCEGAYCFFMPAALCKGVPKGVAWPAVFPGLSGLWSVVD